MEHRWSVRASIPVTVTVLSRGTPVLTTTTRNLSCQGAMLRGNAADLGNVRSVELLFELGRGHRRRQLRLPAYVIHRQGGIGLMFTNHSKSAMREIEQLLQPSQEPSIQARGKR